LVNIFIQTLSDCYSHQIYTAQSGHNLIR